MDKTIGILTVLFLATACSSPQSPTSTSVSKPAKIEDGGGVSGPKLSAPQSSDSGISTDSGSSPQDAGKAPTDGSAPVQDSSTPATDAGQDSGMDSSTPATDAGQDAGKPDSGNPPPVNPCLSNNGGCGGVAYFTCTNNAGAAVCASKDLCTANNGGCGSSTYFTCTNNVGSNPTCTDINECLTNNGGCNAAFYTCSNNMGSAASCVPKDLCATENPCSTSPVAACTNHTGAASTCTCPTGFAGTGVGPNGCADINECLGSNGCSPNANCNNTSGSYTCTCKNGFTGNGTTCTDTNECSANTDGCTQLQTCSNTAGSFTCNACTAGSASCDGVDSNGCEVNTNGDVNNCGSCGHVCPAVGGTATCNSGVCGIVCTGSHFNCDGQAANGCEVDVSNDPNNCGVCGHSCCGGTCGGGSCNLYDTGIIPANTNTYDVDANNLYWSTGQDLNQRPRTGGAVLTTNQPSVQGLAVSGSDVFWDTLGTAANSYQDAGLFSRPVSGGVTTHYRTAAYEFLIATSTDIFPIRSDWAVISDVKRSNNTETYLLSATLADGSMDASAYYKRPYVTDGTYLYATYMSYPTSQVPIVKVPIHGGPVTTFASYTSTVNPTSSTGYNGLSNDSTNLYYILFVPAEPTNTGIWKQPLAGGAATKLVTGSGFSSTTATDGTNVYYADSNAKQIRKVAISGGSSSLLATITKVGGGSITFSGMKVSNSCLYWMNQDTGTIQSMSVNP
jgi:hypothetical protein